MVQGSIGPVHILPYAVANSSNAFLVQVNTLK